MIIRAPLLSLALAGCGADVTEQAPPVRARERIVEQGDGTARLGAALYRLVDPAELNITSAPTIWQAMTPFARTPEGTEGRQGLDASIHNGDDGSFVATVTRYGLPDDAISAEEARVVFQYEGGSWTPTRAYVRRQCRRRPDIGWTTEACR